MAVTIQDELSVINKAVIDLKRDADTAAQKVRTLGEELKLDPKNIQTMKDRFAALNEQIEIYDRYQDSLRIKQQKLQQQLAAQQSQQKTLSADTKEYQKLETQIKRTSEQLTSVERKIKSADSALERLTNTTKLYNKQLDETQKQLKIEKLKSYNSTLGELQKTANKLQIAITLLVGTVAKLTKEAVSQATELYTLSKRYSTNAEKIQQWNKALQLATGDTDLFTESLKVMSKGLSTIPVGRGVAYQNALKGIGVAYKDIQNLDPSAQFQALLKGLQNVSNESLQGSYALTLFGTSGQTIIKALKSGDATIEEYLKKAKDFIIYTDEDTESLTELGLRLDEANAKLQRVTAELSVNAAPALESILDMSRKTALPLLVGLTQQTWILKTAFALLIALIVTKGLIAFAQLIINIKIATAEQKKFLMWTLAAKAAILGLAGVVGIIALVSGAIASANSELEKFADTASEAYGGYGEDLGATIEKTATSMSETTTTVNVTVKGEGNTPISDENAQQISTLVADEVIDRLWGKKIGK